MKLSKEEKEKLESIYQSFLHDKKILRMKEIKTHRGSNCYEHTFKVVKRAMHHVEISSKKNINPEIVLVGAILHDYYLYDWRVDRSKRKGHGKNHVQRALENASKDFNISPEVKEVIGTHMWPINIKNYPKSREAKIVSISDKMVALCESLTSIRYKEKKRDKYLSRISKLFD